jgi:hypothetical protein
MNVAFHAPDVVTIGSDRLGATPQEELGALSVEFEPSVTYIESRWPIDAIWRANQPGDEGTVVDLDAGPARLEIRRVDDEVVFRALPTGSFAFRRAFANREPLERAVDAGLAADASLDLTSEIRALIDEKLLAA